MVLAEFLSKSNLSQVRINSYQEKSTIDGKAPLKEDLRTRPRILITAITFRTCCYLNYLLEKLPSLASCLLWLHR